MTGYRLAILFSIATFVYRINTLFIQLNLQHFNPNQILTSGFVQTKSRAIFQYRITSQQ